jgi:hypothetical protein
MRDFGETAYNVQEIQRTTLGKTKEEYYCANQKPIERMLRPTDPFIKYLRYNARSDSMV